MEDMVGHHIISSLHSHESNGFAERVCLNCEGLVIQSQESAENPPFDLCYTGTLHLAKTCNPHWSYCVPGKLDMTCQSNMQPEYKVGKPQVPYH